jgi:hypothetical protein
MNDPIMDRQQSFLMYATFCGDVEKTAHALGVRAVDVLKVVEEEGWLDRLRGIIELRKSGKPGDLERAINRSLAFVQGHRMRLIIDRAIQHLTGLSEAEFQEQMLSSVGRPPKDGGAQIVKLSTRALADLASAIEKVSAVCFQALGDTTAERVRRKEEGSGDSAGELHAKIALAMSRVGQSNTPRAQLFDAQVRTAEQLAKEYAVPANPHDNDDH